RGRRRDHADRADGVQGSDHQALSAGNQGFAERGDAQRVRGLGGSGPGHQQSGPANSGHCGGASPLIDRTDVMTRSNENGIAMILALFMVLTMSILAASLLFVSQTETWSSMNYRLMSQARYGAEAGVNSAVNYLVKTYVPPGTVADPMANYTTTVSPVTY